MMQSPPAKKFGKIKPLVLVVDDDDGTRLLLQKALKSDYDVLEAQNVNDAINKCQFNQFAAIITDIRMPQQNGYGLIQKLRQNPQFYSIPIFAISSTVTHKEIQRACESGASGVLVKPVRDSDVLSRVQNALQS